MPPTTKFQSFAQLLPWELYRILSARARVFIVEQRCFCQDLDGLDQNAVHVTLLANDNDLAAYARILSPGTKFAEPSIGRVLTTPAYRRQGWGKVVVNESILYCSQIFPAAPIRIAAQQHLTNFYGEFGFVPIGAAYTEDGIPHIDMQRPAQVVRS